MKIETELLIFFLTVVLTIVGYFLNRILARISIYEDKLNDHSTHIALNRQAIEDIKKAA